MKRLITAIFMALALTPAFAQYVPSPENLEARKAFKERRLGIFLHWGIYSTYAQGEWYLSEHKLDSTAYMAAAGGFCPSKFDADAWARAFADAGAGYVTFTSRHHDGFSMYGTRESAFNIVDGTPFGRDPLKELTAAVKARGMRMQYYYSLVDWIRPDYPKGDSGIPKDSLKASYSHYLEFEKAQTRLSAGKPCQIAVSVIPEGLTADIDASLMSSVIATLLDNAVKYSIGRADIRIAAEEKDGHTILSVSDKGIGIAPEKQAHIFEKFYRVPTGDVHDVKGYGIGLFFAKTIVEKHGGHISVDSEPGKGSTFTIEL